MQPGTTQDAILLAKQRWAALHPFDLSAETWETLFADHHPGDVLTAIAKTKYTRDTRPEKAFAGLVYWIECLEAQRLKVTSTWQEFSQNCRKI